MDNNYKHIAFLCGHFKREKDIRPDLLENAGWRRDDYTPKQQRRSKRYYYPEFIDFCRATSVDVGCVRYILPVDTTISLMVDVRGQFRSYSFTVKDLTLYLLPYQMVLYSLHVEQDANCFDDCSALIYTLRYIDGFGSDEYRDFYRVAVQPIVQVYNLLKISPLQDTTMLVENGNKLRVFQIINAPSNALKVLTDEEKWHLQYDLATFSTVSVEGNKAIDSPSEKWQTSNKKCHIAVFESWTALSMLDSFNILCSDCESQMDNWINNYFGCIYMQALFQKVCLFDFNNRFKRALQLQGNRAASRLVNSLVMEYETFERNCCFNRISYNFLPQLVSDAVNNSLEINDEMKQLYRLMAKERTRNEESSRKKMNSLLIGISFMTLFSAIWDACSMLNEMMSFKSHFGNTIWGFRIAGIIIAVIVVGVLLYLYKRKRGN